MVHAQHGTGGVGGECGVVGFVADRPIHIVHPCLVIAHGIVPTAIEDRAIARGDVIRSQLPRRKVVGYGRIALAGNVNIGSIVEPLRVVDAIKSGRVTSGV